MIFTGRKIQPLFTPKSRAGDSGWKQRVSPARSVVIGFGDQASIQEGEKAVRTAMLLKSFGD
jgi:hypothetical protein